MLHIQSRHRLCSKLWVCVYHQPLIYGLNYKLFLGRKKSARSSVDCRCYFKRFNLMWKTCLFNAFTMKRMREHTKARKSSVFVTPIALSACLRYTRSKTCVLLRLLYRHCVRILLNHLKTKHRLLYLKAQSVPRCKHFSSRL